MSIVVNNLQRLVRINKRQLIFDVKLLMKITGYEGFDLGIMLVNNNHIRGLNRDYRNVDEVTDVLAFPFHEVNLYVGLSGLKHFCIEHEEGWRAVIIIQLYDEIPEENAGNLPDVPVEERMLGDIVLGIPYILKESQRHGTDFKSDILTHMTHGIFHLVGYDHEMRNQWLRMYSKEEETLKKFNSLTGYTCLPLLGVGHNILT